MASLENEQKSLEKVAKTAKLTAIIDALLGGICAANGSLYFVWFMLLAGFMWVYGVYTQSKADNLQGE
jgi:hypothetical protein